MPTEATTEGLRPLEKAALLRSQLAENLAGDFAAFVKKAWRILHPARPLVWSWHYDLLCEYLTAVKQRKVKRLIVNVPPRTAKSTIATICFPCWVWASDPSQNFLSANYRWTCRASTRSCAATCCRAAGIAASGATSSASPGIATRWPSS